MSLDSLSSVSKYDAKQVRVCCVSVSSIQCLRTRCWFRRSISHLMPSMPCMASTFASPYSTLHQGYLYLQSELAAEESKGESLAQVLTSLKSKLEKLEAGENHSNPRKLKLSIKSTKYKLSKCQQNERKLADNLNRIAIEIAELKRHDWYGNYTESYPFIQHNRPIGWSPAWTSFALQLPTSYEQIMGTRCSVVPRPGICGWHPAQSPWNWNSNTSPLPWLQSTPTLPSTHVAVDPRSYGQFYHTGLW